RILSDTMFFNHIVNLPYTLNIEFINNNDNPINIQDIDIKLMGLNSEKEFKINFNEASGKQDFPISVSSKGRVNLYYNISIPSESAGNNCVLITSVNYFFDGKQNYKSSWLSVSPEQPVQISFMPERIVIDSFDKDNTFGMSVINNTDDIYKSKLKIIGDKFDIEPSNFEMSIDPRGLDAKVFSIKPKNYTTAGKYAVWIYDENNNPLNWLAIDVAYQMKRTSEKKFNLDIKKWKEITHASLVANPNQKSPGVIKMVYDDENVYLFAQLDSEQNQSFHTENSILVAFAMADSEKEGAKKYKSLDSAYKINFNSDVKVTRQLPINTDNSSRLQGNIKANYKKVGTSALYEIVLPWSSLPNGAKENGFAISLMINHSGNYAYLGQNSCIASMLDARYFVPVVIVN
ncbi:MAG: sugar-binding protein, partial [Armatimonadota bacterium]